MLSDVLFLPDFYLSDFSPQGTWSRKDAGRSCENTCPSPSGWTGPHLLLPGIIFPEGSSPGCPRYAAESWQPVLLSFRPSLPVSNV